MAGPISLFFTEDHDRLDALLRKAVERPGLLDRSAFDAFRAGLLRHIALEEKLLLPAARRARAGQPLPVAGRLRIDHGAIASLLVPTPTPEIAAEIRTILDPHNRIEEEPGGLYQVCDDLLGAEAGLLLEKARAYPPVKVARYNDGPGVYRRAADALAASARQLGPGARDAPTRRSPG